MAIECLLMIAILIPLRPLPSPGETSNLQFSSIWVVMLRDNSFGSTDMCEAGRNPVGDACLGREGEKRIKIMIKSTCSRPEAVNGYKTSGGEAFLGASPSQDCRASVGQSAAIVTLVP